MRKEQIALITFAVWLLLISFFLLLAQRVNFEIFFIFALLGFLILVELIMPKYIKPGYLRYIYGILATGIVIFGVIVILKVMGILGFEIVF
jgi:hypothetical protein